MERSAVTSGAARIIGAAFALLAALGFAEPAAEAPDAPVAVVATTNIVGDVVAQVGGERISLYVMLPIDADPHVFQATPRDARQVADSDVVFVNGAGLEEGFLGDLVASAEPRRVVDLTSGLPLLRLGDEHDEEHDEHDDEHAEGEHEDEDEHEEEHADEHEEDEHEHEEGEHDDDEHEHEEDEHDDEHDDEHEDEHGHDHHGEFDPHVWMDPTLVAVWAQTIAAALAEVDPGFAGGYTERAAKLADELHELDAWVRERVAAVPPAKRILIADHDVLGYFADRYGFLILDSIVPGFSTASEPSARHLAALSDAIEEHAVPAIFAGTTVSPRVAQVLAADLNLEVVSLYTGSLSAPDGPAGTYQDFIRTNVDRIVTALGGPE